MKIRLIIAMIIWSILGVKIIKAQDVKEVDVVAAFLTMDCETVNTQIDAFGSYSNQNMSTEAKKKLVTSVASDLGIDGKYKLKESDTSVILNKTTGNSILSVKAITDSKDKEYISVQLTINGRIDCAMSYKQLVEDIFEADGVDGYVNLNLVGKIKGSMNYYEKNKMANRLLDELGAKVVTENRDDELYTIYAYTDIVKEYIYNSGKKVNINITQDYDYTENVSIIRLSTPLNNLDY